MSDLLKACGLWTKTSASGRKYLTGRMAGLRVLVFENARRGEEGEPDFHLHFGQADAYKPAGAISHQQRVGLVDMREREPESVR